MAYMSQEKKAKLVPGIKAVLDKYGMKATLAVRHYSTLVINIKPGPLDVISNYLAVAENRNASYGPAEAANFKYKDDYYRMDVNPYAIDEHFSGKVKEFLTELKAAMMVGNHDRSDVMTDYWDVGWYVDINIHQKEVAA